MNDRGVLRGDVIRFADVGGEIVEFFFREMEFPRARAHGFKEQSAVVEKRIARRSGGGAEEHRGDVDAVDFSIGGQRGAGEFGERREDIDHGGDRIRRGAGGNVAGPPSEAGDPNATFEGGALAAAERGVGGALLGRAAVVGYEEDKGVAVEAEIAKCTEDLADTPIDFLNPITEEAVG